MKDFKTKQQMTAGHYCWGGKAMKKAEGGYAEGSMRSESTEAAKSDAENTDAVSKMYDARKKFIAAKGQKAKKITEADYADAQKRYADSADKNYKTKERTGHYSAGLPKEFGDEELRRFRDDYDSDYGLAKKRGGKVMKKAEGGSVRSQFGAAFGEARKRGDKTFEFNGKQYGTQLAKPKMKDVSPMRRSDKDTSLVDNAPMRSEEKDTSPAKAAPSQKSGYRLPDIGLRTGKAGEPAIKFGDDEAPKQTKSNYNYGVKASDSDLEMKQFLEKKRGGSVAKPKLASDKKKYSDRDMQGIISQAKQMAPKIIQANQARAAQAQAAAGAQRPPLGGAMPARPPMGAMPAGAMPAMKKGGKLKLRRKG